MRMIKYHSLLAFSLIIFLHLFPVQSCLPSDQKLPEINGKEVVATVDEEPIFLDELNSVLASAHATIAGPREVAPINYSSIVSRLINRKLIVLEGRSMGLQELPEIKKKVQEFGDETLMRLVLEESVQEVTPDEKAIERLYKEKTTEWKIRSIVFEKEDDARGFQERLSTGEDYDHIVKNAVEKGLGKADDASEYLKNQDLRPPIAKLVSELGVGSVSPVVSLGKDSYVIFKVEDMRHSHTENADMRKEAFNQAVKEKKRQTAEKYYLELRDKYAKINNDLLETLDFDKSMKDFLTLQDDTRIVAEIRGDDAITVGEFASAIQKKYFHGIEMALEAKTVNKKARDVLEDMIQTRVLLKEADIRHLQDKATYKKRVRNYEDTLVFGAFIQKVISPDIKMTNRELEAYYKKNIDTYSTPEMMRIRSLAFDNENDASSTLNKLRKGTDFDWLGSQATGQIEKGTKGLLTFDGQLIAARSLPQGVQAAVSGATSGDYKLYASDKGVFYVLYLYHIVPPAPRPFNSVREEIANALYNEKLKESVGKWADDLRQYYPVKLYGKDLKK